MCIRDSGILVCGDTRNLISPGFWVQDCSAATQNLLIAAHELGLGAVWTGVYPMDPVDGRVTGFTKHCPVSYTHLRAHETPEHLVCRLLLEKKKQKNHKNKNNNMNNTKNKKLNTKTNKK